MEERRTGESHQDRGARQQGAGTYAAGKDETRRDIAQGVRRDDGRADESRSLQGDAQALHEEHGEERHQGEELQVVGGEAERQQGDRRNLEQRAKTGRPHACRPAPIVGRDAERQQQRRDQYQQCAQLPVGTPVREQRPEQHREGDSACHEGAPQTEHHAAPRLAGDPVQHGGRRHYHDEETEPLDEASGKQPGEVLHRRTEQARPAENRQPTGQQPAISPATHQEAGGDAAEYADERKGGHDPAQRGEVAAEAPLQRRQGDGRLADMQGSGDAGEDHIGNCQPSRAGLGVRTSESGRAIHRCLRAWSGARQDRQTLCADSDSSS